MLEGQVPDLAEEGTAMAQDGREVSGTWQWRHIGCLLGCQKKLVRELTSGTLLYTLRWGGAREQLS